MAPLGQWASLCRHSQAGPLSRKGAEGCEGLVCATLFIFSEGSCLSPAIKITCLETSSSEGEKEAFVSREVTLTASLYFASAPSIKEELAKVMRGQGPSERGAGQLLMEGRGGKARREGGGEEGEREGEGKAEASPCLLDSGVSKAGTERSKEGRNQQEIKANGDTLNIKSEAKRPGDRKIKSSREERHGEEAEVKGQKRREVFTHRDTELQESERDCGPGVRDCFQM